jgi:hypothetical protein
MRCTFKTTGEEDERGQRRWKCSRCERQIDWTPHDASRIFAKCRVPGWGDYVTYWLTLFGLTKQRVQWLTGKPCGCGERQEKLNTWGDWFTSLFSNPPPDRPQ